MDRVKIKNIHDFTTPQGLSDKLLKVEQSKEGVYDVNILNAFEVSLNNPYIDSNEMDKMVTIPAYIIEYKVDSSRGENHYMVLSSVRDSNLYVFTIQCKEKNYEDLTSTINNIRDSFTFL
jgi:hypothetical protein